MCPCVPTFMHGGARACVRVYYVCVCILSFLQVHEYASEPEDISRSLIMDKRKRVPKKILTTCKFWASV
jgi:hypothetical protein